MAGGRSFADNPEARSKLEVIVRSLFGIRGIAANEDVVHYAMQEAAGRVTPRQVMAGPASVMAFADAAVLTIIGAKKDAVAALAEAERLAATERSQAQKTAQSLMAQDRRARGDGGSSARFTSLKESSNTEYLASRELARSLGMSWALDSPDLLRLGPNAIRTLHVVGYDKQVFDDMTKRGKFKADQVVAIAGFAQRNNLTPEEAKEFAKSATDVSEGVGKLDPEMQRRFTDAMSDFAKSDNPKDWQRVEKVMQEAEKRDPSLKGKHDDLRERVRKESAMTADEKAKAETKDVEADAKEAKAEVKVAAAEAKAAFFDSEPATKSDAQVGATSKPAVDGESEKSAPAEPNRPAPGRPASTSTPAAPKV